LKIAVLGAGALGCAIGAALTQAGHETWLLNRSAGHVEALQRDGLRVDDAAGTRVVPVRASTRPDEVGIADLVVVLVKSFHTESAMRGALALVGPDTLVLSLQNGLGHEDILAGIVGRERVLAGKTYVGGVLRGPGHILSGVAGKATFVGELDGRVTPRVCAVAEAFTAAGLQTTVSDNILGTMWDKLLVNVATGALTGITRLSYGQLYDAPLPRRHRLRRRRRHRRDLARRRRLRDRLRHLLHRHARQPAGVGRHRGHMGDQCVGEHRPDSVPRARVRRRGPPAVGRRPHGARGHQPLRRRPHEGVA